MQNWWESFILSENLSQSTGCKKIHGDENNENKLHYLEDSPYVDGSFHFEYLPLLYADSRLNAQ